MPERILFVDDDEKILSMFQRSLRGQFEVEVCPRPEEAAAKVAAGPPYAVVVSDLRMPGMDGVAFLAKVREFSPNTVRIMLTGHADLDAAIGAVNEGSIFRFLTKPCDLAVLAAILQTALRQYQLVMAEKTLLERTLKGCIKVLSETLAYVNPEALGRGDRIKRYVRAMALAADPKRVWQYEIAAMLSQLGCMMLPAEALRNLAKGKPLTVEERQAYEMHPFIGSNLLANIPRMEGVAKMVAYQEKNFDGSGVPLDAVKGEEIPFGARILRIALDFEMEAAKGKKWCQAFTALEKKIHLYDPELLKHLENSLGVEAHFEPESLKVGHLLPGMILNQDILAPSGLLWAKKGLELTDSAVAFLRSTAERISLKGAVDVLVPAEQVDTAKDRALTALIGGEGEGEGG